MTRAHLPVNWEVSLSPEPLSRSLCPWTDCPCLALSDSPCLPPSYSLTLLHRYPIVYLMPHSYRQRYGAMEGGIIGDFDTEGRDIWEG